jgi:hypothetical protein
VSEYIFKLKAISAETTSILNKYYEQVHKDAISGKISFYDAVTINMVLAEGYPFLDQKAEADELIYHNMEIIRKGLEDNVLYGKLSLFGGLAEVALSVYTVNKQTNNYGKFLDKLNILLTNQLIYLIDSLYHKIDDLREDDYDSISGLSGIASYLLLLEGYDEITEKVLELMVHICSYKNINGIHIPNWHIQSENIDEDSKMSYPRGYLNLSLAHGIAGPLVILSKAYKKGIIIKGQREAILNIVNIYRKFSLVTDKFTYLPGILSLEGYLSGVSEHKKVREGWCYGGIGIARALYIAADALEDHEVRGWAYKIIEERAQMNIEEYDMISPTLCHGYAGILSILAITARERDGVIVTKRINIVRKQIVSMFNVASKYGFLDIEIRNKNEKYVRTAEDTCIFLIGASGVVLALLSLNHESTLLDSHLLI